MLRKNAKKISAALLISLTLSFGSVSFADKVKDLRNEQEEIKKDLKQTQEELKKSQESSKSVQKQIDELDQKVNKASIELTKVEDELDEIGKGIEQNEKELEEAEVILAEKQESFESRIKVMYINGDIGYLELLLTSNDIKDFFSRKEMVKAIAEQDKELLRIMKEQKDIIEEKKVELEAQRASLSAAKTKIESRKKDLEIATREKSDLMSRLEKDVENYEKEYDKLNAISEDVGNEIIKLQAEQRERERAKKAAEQAKGNYSNAASSSSGSSSSGSSNAGSTPTSGRMNWPVPGHSRVSSPYGYRIHPISGRSSLHTGIDIPAPAGANVVAASSGTVIKSGWYGGYGLVVMIDHGGGIVTLYAHNSSTVARAGQSVGAGSVIAKVGSTGNSTGPHCHFEVRRGGRHIDPLPWVR